MSEIESSAPTPSTDVSALLGKLLSNPDLLGNLSAVLGSPGAADSASSVPTLVNTENIGEGISRVLSNPEMMAKLPDVMKMIAPMMQGAQSSQETPVSALSSPEAKGGSRDRRSCRNDLLLALKPFLSPERCHAIDMLLGLSRLGDVLQKMI